jgi:uncharacterized membrane protein YeaQ/YmgE (transglycosylase-associated protein family)
MSAAVIIWIVIAGLIVGALARFLVPGRDPVGFLGTLVIGVGGAFLGYWIGGLLVGNHSVHEHPWLWAIVGAVILVLVSRLITHRRRRMFARRW